MFWNTNLLFPGLKKGKEKKPFKSTSTQSTYDTEHDKNDIVAGYQFDFGFLLFCVNISPKLRRKAIHVSYVRPEDYILLYCPFLWMFSK